MKKEIDQIRAYSRNSRANSFSLFRVLSRIFAGKFSYDLIDWQLRLISNIIRYEMAFSPENPF